MKIYNIEQSRGLSNVISAHTKASVISPVLKERNIAQAAKLNRCESSVPKGMMSFSSILVTTNWNKNDDIFSNDETWRARSTPRFKPVNIEHQGQEGSANTTCGFIVSSECVDDEYKTMHSEDFDSDDCPMPDGKFHILTNAYLWADYFPNTVNSIKSGIDNNSMFVSMEAFFDDFGYGLRTEGSDNINLLPRNEITAWLTSYLRVYGGKGEVVIDGTKYRIGRWLRSITFSGMGCTDNPANPESIIFEDYIAHANLKQYNMSKLDDNSASEWSVSKEMETISKEISENGVLNTVAEKKILWLTY